MTLCSIQILRNKKKITSMSEIRFLQSYLMRRFNVHTVFPFFRFTLCRTELLFGDRLDGNLKRINSALSLYSQIPGSEEVIRVFLSQNDVTRHSVIETYDKFKLSKDLTLI